MLPCPPFGWVELPKAEQEQEGDGGRRNGGRKKQDGIAWNLRARKEDGRAQNLRAQFGTLYGPSARPW